MKRVTSNAVATSHQAVSKTAASSNHIPPYRRETNPSEFQDPWWLGGAETFVPLSVDPKWINLDVLRSWMLTCICDHGPNCSPLEVLNGIPDWLIDVQDLCLVRCTGSHAYMALSYVWGQVPPSKTTEHKLDTSQESGTFSRAIMDGVIPKSVETTKSNIDIFQVPGAFSVANSDVIIPKTIRHAMELVKLLGERYLWVDRLCICQDDEDAKGPQIDIMGDIYNNALVTLIAANGWDADHGLRGIKGITEPRNLPPNAGDEYFKAIDPQSSVWYSRGWTFQEAFFSRRKLVFYYQTVIWECGHHTRHEAHGSQEVGKLSTNLQMHPGAYDRLLGRKAFTTRTLPFFHEYDLRVWMELVNHYNMRDFTFPEDAPRAFASVTNAFTRTAAPAGFIWGLPIDCFDVALLWIPQAHMERRRPRYHGSTVPPSWSWMGWQGTVMANAWYDVWNYKDALGENQRLSRWQTAIDETWPECVWYAVEEGKDGHDGTPSTEQFIPVMPGARPLRPMSCLFTEGWMATFTIRKEKEQTGELRGLFRDKVKGHPLVGPAGVSGLLITERDLNLEDGLNVECLAIANCPNAVVGRLARQVSVWDTKGFYHVLWLERNGYGQSQTFTRRGVGRIMKKQWDENEDKRLETIILI
ncbi:heterokaryon incompatibility protein-domain-containing protein [Bombardia bombarda]|uniref:Heterokaryon incompatibility protein-domain-containing protein n=1 Tax=Bombardia bombarda TaxID=252184 RepID=A0AA39WH54_9PEZI|nr:heterokaryon incompatibility protein-domain-containing protein [Bombardia bombarda]